MASEEDSADGQLDRPSVSNGTELPDYDYSDDFGRILNSVPPILERVLAHLPMRDLNRSAQVCKSWHQVGRLVKRRRQHLFWMFWAARRRKLPPSVCSSCSITEHVRYVLNCASSEPKLGILFVTNSFFEEQGQFAEESSQSDTPVIDYLVSALPQDCLLLGTCSSGMVGTTLGCDKHRCVEVESTEGFSCLLLPNIPGMEVFPFVINNNEDLIGYEGKEVLTEEELVKLAKIPVGKEVKCLLVFCNFAMDGESGARLMAKTLLWRQNYQMALGGGFVDTFVAPRGMLSPHVYMPHTMGIAICGDGVRAASIVLKPSVRRRKRVEKALEQLKACNFPTKNSFALMFACVSRGIDHHGEPNVEADAFQKIFPDTPLFGFFGNGEIGINYIPKDGSTAEAAQVKKFSFKAPHEAYCKKSKLVEDDTIFHGFTTIIVLICVEKS